MSLFSNDEVLKLESDWRRLVANQARAGFQSIAAGCQAMNVAHLPVCMVCGVRGPLGFRAICEPCDSSRRESGQSYTLMLLEGKR